MADHGVEPLWTSGNLIDLSGRVALVTGGTKNIGRTIAEGFAACGAAVAVVGRSDADALDATLVSLASYGGLVHGVLADVGEASETSRIVQDVSGSLGPIDVLVNNAAIRPSGQLKELNLGDWQTVMDVNLRAPFLLAKEVLPGMRERRYGRIINIAGLSSIIGSPDRVHVSSSKAGLMGQTIALATESALDQVTVNSVVPGLIDTERHAPEWYPDLKEFYKRRLARIPMGRLGRPEEVAYACLFLASDMANYITGQAIFVTGGMHPMVRES